MERLTVRQAGARLGVSPTTIRRMIAAGELQAAREIRPQGARWIVLFGTDADAPSHAPNRASGTSLVTNAMVSDLRERVAFLEQLTAQQANQISELIRRLPALPAGTVVPTEGTIVPEPVSAVGDTPPQTPATPAAKRGWLSRLLGR